MPMALKMHASILLTGVVSPALALLNLLTLTTKSTCKDWCADSDLPWEKLCKRKNCDACSQCDTTTTTTAFTGCKDWCAESPKGWEKLCKRDACASCTPCVTSTTEFTGCKDWCLTSTRTWDQLCKRDDCASCTPCATSTTEFTGCKDWCLTSTRTWDKLCKRDNCAQCSECAHLTCKSWCPTSTRTWERLCKKPNCRGCPECSTTTPAASDCESWCATSTRPWEKLCKKPKCAGCDKCTEPTTTLPVVDCSEPGGARATANRGKNGYEYQVVCDGCPLNGTVWGTGPFFDNSSVCGAAYFQGLVDEQGKGLVVVTVLPGADAYLPGSNSRRNTSAFAAGLGSFSVSGADLSNRTSANATSVANTTGAANTTNTTGTAAASMITCMDSGGASALVHRGQNGYRYHVNCTGCNLAGPVWGTDPFTDDSSICGSAYFLGVIGDQGRGPVIVTVGPGESSYPDGSNSRRAATSYGAWPGSFSIAGGSATD